MSVEVTFNDFAKEGADKGLDKIITETCIRVHAQAVLLAPVDKGQLSNSLMWKTNVTEGGFNEQGSGEKAPSNQELDVRPREHEGFVGTNSDHWYPEFGTRYQRAQPFVRPAGQQVAGSPPTDIAKKFGREAMEQEFRVRKTRRQVLG